MRGTRALLGALAWGWLCAAAWAQAVPPPVVAGDTVRVGVVERFPPFHDWKSAGPASQPVGFDADLLAELARVTGLRFQFVRYADFPAVLAALRDGQVRLTTAIAQTPERATYLRFTRPYASVQQAFVGASTITSVPATPDLSGRRVAVTRGYVAESIAAERFPGAGRPTYPTVESAIDAVARGDADFVFEALPTLRSLLNERPRAGLAVLRSYGFPEGHLRLAADLRETELVRQLDNAILALDPAVLRRLRDQWLPSAAPPDAPALPPVGSLAPLRVGYLPGDAPFTLEAGPGRADGIGIRMMQAVAQRAGLGVAEFVPMNLGPGLEALAAGKLDAMLGLTDVAERRHRMAFVGPYRANPLVIVSRRAYSVWDLQKLAGQRLAMIKGFFGTPYIRSAYPTVEIVECGRFDDCQALVEAGQAEAALYGLQGAFARLGPRAGASLTITGTVPGLYDEHNIGLSLARASLAPRLRDALNLVLLHDMPRIEREWAEAERQGRIDWERLRTGVALAAAVLLLLAGGWWWHSRLLRREIARTQEARRESEGYLAFMAHEVRNSLQSVSGAVALLRGSSRPDARQTLLLDALGRSSRSTLGLLNGLLDRHRLHAGQLSLDLRAESLQRVLGAVHDEVQLMAQAKGLVLRFEPDPALAGWWRVDALRLQQVVRNLLVNAVKFSERGTITLQATLAPAARGPGWHELTLQVHDQGRGLGQQELAQVFRPFRTEGGDRPGSGLGLALSRELARALGGELQARSEPGRGSTFTLRVPVQAATAPEPGSGPRLQRMLVVEDSPVYGLLLRQAFDSLGVSVELADSLHAARAALVASVAGAGHTIPAFDLVLSDTHLSDGLVDELFSFMRQTVRPGVRLPPVVCMSAEFDEATLARLAAAGAAEMLTKDSDVPAFARRVVDDYAALQGRAVAG